MKYSKIVWDGKVLTVPEDMGLPRADQLTGSCLDNLTELSGRVCYDYQTEVLTRNGWVKLPDLKEDIEVATYNKMSGEMEFQVPTQYIKKQHKGTFYEIENTKVSLKVTADHELWCLPKSSSEWQFIRAEEMCGRKYYLKRHAIYPGEQCESIQLPEYKYSQKISNQFGNYGTVTKKTSGLLIKADKMLAWARFLGYYFSEGCVSKKNGTGRRVIIYQNQENVEPIIKTVKELGFKYKTWLDKRNNVLRVMISNGPVARYLDKFGKKACDKHLPRECLNWNSNLRNELFDALHFGDGHTTSSGTRVYNTCSELLADDVQELIIKNGKVSTISYSPVAKMYRVRESLHDLHMVNKHKKQDRIIEGDETVYCVSVPNRILLIRRNKKVILCANCYDSLGSGRDSKSYHKHIAEVNHGSVQEHGNLTFEINVDSTHYNLICQTLLNRPGIWVDKNTNEVKTHLRLTANLRSIREWHQFNSSSFCELFGNKLQFLAKQHAPLVLQEIDEKNNNDKIDARIVEPLSDNEKWISVFFTNVSRGFSHELVRHKYRTAVSQRSTRYVDENESDWCWHPLILKHSNEANEPFKNTHSTLKQCEEVCKDTYSKTVNVLQKFLIDQGVDKFTARKQARGAARGVLGNSLMTELIFSASVAEWKWIFHMRAAASADAEIRVVMNEVYEQFVKRFPNEFEGYKKVECPDKIGYGLERI